MTTALGIAATTAVLRRLLQNALPKADLAGTLGNIEVSALPPDRIDVAKEKSRLNLFLYQVTPNTGWMNTAFPSHSFDGERLTNQPLALDLHYMLSAYGEQDLFGEMLLGYGAMVLHQTTVLTRDTVQATFATSGGPLPPELTLLATTGLESQEELVKLTMVPMTPDDMSRLWQVFGEKYRPSIPFTATVLLLRGADAAAAGGPPVLKVQSVVTGSVNPVIDAVSPGLVASGDTLTLTGTSLALSDATALFSSGDTAPVVPTGEPLQVTVVVPGTMPAGVSTVSVSLPVHFGADVRQGPVSNVAAFVVRPRLVPGSGDHGLRVSGKTSSGTARKASVRARLAPRVTRRQHVELLLNERGAPSSRPPHSYQFQAPARDADPNESTDEITFAVDGVEAGTYLARVRVDGAETALTTNTSTGVYDGPTVNLT